MRPLMILQLLVLLALANWASVAARRIFGDRLSFPLDGGSRLPDRQRLFGPAKTLRGIMIAMAATAVGGSLIGPGWKIGLLVAVAAMAGDVFSSFLIDAVVANLNAILIRAADLDAFGHCSPAGAFQTR